jgi:outer membrane protein assembly factor BamB
MRKFLRLLRGVAPVFLVLLLTSCGLISGQAPDNMTVLWSLELKNGLAMPSLLSGNLLGGVFRTSDIWQFGVIDLDQHKVLWKSASNQGLVSLQTFVSDGAYWFVHNGFQSRLEIYRNDGTMFTFNYPDVSEGNTEGLSPILDDTTLYVGSGVYIYSFDISNPEKPVLNWRLQAPKWLTDIVLDEGWLYVGVQISENAPSVFKLNPKDGSTVWSATTYADTVQYPHFVEAMAIRGDKLFVSASSTMQAFDKNTGKRIWISEPLPCGWLGFGDSWVLELDDKSIYATVGSCVYSIAQADGKVNWIMSAVDTDANFTFSDKPTLYNGVVYAANGYLWAIDAETGKVLGMSRADNDSQGSYIHVYKNQIIVWGKNLYAYKPIR